MLEEFIQEQFNGNRKEAIKCIADELSSLKYEKTGNVDNCRKYAQQLTPIEKQGAYEFFKMNLAARKKIDKKLSHFTLTYEDVKTAEEDKERFRKYVLIDVLAILFINLRAISIGAIPFIELYSLIVTPFFLFCLLKILIRHYRFKSIKEYSENEDELMEKLEGIYGNDAENLLSEEGKVL